MKTQDGIYKKVKLYHAQFVNGWSALANSAKGI
jgi:hypothetical protein